MRPRIARIVVAMLFGATASVASTAVGVGLTCMHHADVERAAREALAGDHPLWADAYIVGRVEAIARPRHAPITLTVSPTHVFSGDPADRIRIAARSDGPPDPNSWQIGGLYFIALADVPGQEDVNGLVAPCAPNFEITSTEQLDRLVGAAPDVEVREDVRAPPTADSTPLIAVAVGAAAGVLGLGGWLALGRHPRRNHRA